METDISDARVATEAEFYRSFRTLSHYIRTDNFKRGFGEGALPDNVAQSLMLIVSEISEALEAYRNNDAMDDKLIHRRGIEVELADAVIRIMDLSAHMSLDVSGALVEKLAFNRTRPFRHGKSF